MIYQLITALLLLTACGSDDKGSEATSTPALSTWTAAQSQGLVTACYDARITDGEADQTKMDRVAAFCGCMTTEVGKRYSYDQFISNSDTIVEGLRADGTKASCITKQDAAAYVSVND